MCAHFTIESFPNPDVLAATVADAWLEKVRATEQAGKIQSVALSGGRITQKFFACIVDHCRKEKWRPKHVHFFWADERCVPPDDAESNFRMAQELLFQPLHVTPDQIHRVKGELPPDDAAKSASDELQHIAPNGLDLIFLGMGEDGHVASLFPGHPPQTIKSPYHAVADSPKPPPHRVTLSYEAIAAAHDVWVLASGTGKCAALRESLLPDGSTPLSRILHLRKDTHIFSDIQL
jgi:6-phosphogluconolactonase